MPSVMLLLTVLTAAQLQGSARTSNPPTMRDCLVTLIEDVEVPAQEPGVLVDLIVDEGDPVEENTVIGKIDDSQAQSEKLVAEYEQQAAAEKATSDIDVRYARAATKVAEVEYLKAVDAVRKVPGSIAQVELSRLQLTHRRTELQIEQAQLERKIAGLTAQTRAAEVAAAENNIQRRHIKAPINGVVVSIKRRPGEWLQPGEAVLRIVRVDRLRIEGYLNAGEFEPDEITGRTALVEVSMARGRSVKYQGKVTFVSPLVEAGGEYRVWTEVDNVTTTGVKNLLRPGLTAQVTIYPN